jgi:APA family basic amino acid/polyamine antiporter
VAVGWSGYFVSVLQDFNINIPALTGAPVSGEGCPGHTSTGIINLPAVLIIAAVTAAGEGVSESATVSNIIVAIK